LFQFTGGESVKDWKFIDSNKISNQIDTLEIETAKKTLG
jgi:hypothetical protein